MANGNTRTPVETTAAMSVEEKGVQSFLRHTRGRTGVKHVSAYASTEERDFQGRGKKVRSSRFPRSATAWFRELIFEPIFEPDFQPRSYAYRPQRKAHQAGLAKAILQNAN